MRKFALFGQGEFLLVGAVWSLSKRQKQTLTPTRRNKPAHHPPKTNPHTTPQKQTLTPTHQKQTLTPPPQNQTLTPQGLGVVWFRSGSGTLSSSSRPFAKRWPYGAPSAGSSRPGGGCCLTFLVGYMFVGWLRLGPPARCQL